MKAEIELKTKKFPYRPLVYILNVAGVDIVIDNNTYFILLHLLCNDKPRDNKGRFVKR